MGTCGADGDAADVVAAGGLGASTAPAEGVLGFVGLREANELAKLGVLAATDADAWASALTFDVSLSEVLWVAGPLP